VPTKTGKDKRGCFARWGKSGKKYYYQCGNKKAKDKAVKKANKQAQAIYSSGWKGR